MAYSTPLTAVSNATLTAAQWNASMRDNMLETPAAKATATGQMFISTGANAIAARTPTTATVATSETFTPSIGVFGDLTTVGPTVGPLTTGTAAIVLFGAYMSNGTGTGSGVMGFNVSGATTIAASLAESVRVLSPTTGGQAWRPFAVSMPTLTAGSNTFTAKYTTHSGGAVTAADRKLIVIPL
jgi:hypothetical protein